jgi:nickel/cobalt transporter (NiCoT) family protein
MVRIANNSVSAALFIGTIELTQILSKTFGLENGIWHWIQTLNPGWVGYILVGLFIVSWLVSFGIWRFTKIEKRWGHI